ncbi:hypothetical protein IWW45_004504 [Coemansia sp. RSA 485]|nr:hypothetical protein IWW45_004504 [Coemansia sp. RSA 485]
MEAKKAENRTLSGLKLGQIADYAYQLWKVQPMRNFVPVFFVNGCRLSMIIFARSGCHRVELGSLFRKQIGDYSGFDQEVAVSLSRLWFLIIQPPDMFGHITDILAGASRFIFSGSATSAAVQAVSTLQYIKCTNEEHNRIVKIGDKFDRDIRVLGCLCHVYRTTYGDKRAVLKLAWMKPDRYPEGALYEVLQQSGMNGIPTVYSSGILCKDFFGYRLEFLLIEDCGETLCDIFKQFVGKKTTTEKIYRVVPLVIKNVMCNLLRAYSAGVMHRDISSGNISIREYDVFIIDWGCSKLVTNDSDDLKDRFEQLAAKWDFGLKNVIDKANTRDPFTGTHEYMSIRVLSEAAERSIFDDIESLFYVVIHFLQCAKEQKITNFLGTRCMANNVAAALKLSTMCGSELYQKRAGIDTYPDDLLQMLDQLYNMLFMVDGVNVCYKLLDCAPEMRKLDYNLIRSIIGKDAFNGIFPPHASDSPEDAIEPSSIAAISAFSQPESTSASASSGKRKAEDETDDETDRCSRRRL